MTLGCALRYMDLTGGGKKTFFLFSCVILQNGMVLEDADVLFLAPCRIVFGHVFSKIIEWSRVKQKKLDSKIQGTICSAV